MPPRPAATASDNIYSLRVLYKDDRVGLYQVWDSPTAEKHNGVVYQLDLMPFGSYMVFERATFRYRRDSGSAQISLFLFTHPQQAMYCTGRLLWVPCLKRLYASGLNADYGWHMKELISYMPPDNFTDFADAIFRIQRETTMLDRHRRWRKR